MTKAGTPPAFFIINQRQPQSNLPLFTTPTLSKSLEF